MAEAEAVKLNEKIDRGGNPLAVPEVVAPPERVTLATTWEWYIDSRIDSGTRAIRKVDLIGRKDLLPEVGDNPVRDVSVQDIERVSRRPLQRGIG
jgi:hypothetical protein